MRQRIEQTEQIEQAEQADHEQRALTAAAGTMGASREQEALEERQAPMAPTSARGVALVGYAPITRVDAERREIELCATSEALDAHGTIFDYGASKAAFTRWLGNVREMHERRAVGRRVAVRCDDEARRIYVRLRISRGAQDTWEKVLDGTLRGASIGASDVIWRRERRTLAGRSRVVNVATRYDLAELSLVDNPSNPDALGVTFVRDATPDVTLLDPLEPAAALEAGELTGLAPDAPGAPDMPAEPVNIPVDAPGGAASGLRLPALPLHEASRALLAGCGCAHSDVALATLADDELAATHTDAPGEALATSLTRTLAAGLRLSAARLARLEATLGAAVATLRAAQAEGAAQAMRAGDEQRRAAAEQAESQAAQAAHIIEELRARVARLEAQPAPGGPAARAVAVEKSLGGLTAGGVGEPGRALAAGAEVRALEALAGRLRDPQAQLAVAAEMIRLQQRGE